MLNQFLGFLLKKKIDGLLQFDTKKMMQNITTVYSKKLDYSTDPRLVLDSLLKSIGGLDSRINTGNKVLIKPNFVAPFPKAATDIKFIDFFVSKIRALGGIPIIGESSGFEFNTGATFDILGIREYAEAEDVELIDFEKEPFVKIELNNGVGTVEVTKIALEATLIINLPVLKGHTITKVTGAVKNLFGLLSKSSRRYLHCHKLEKGIASLAHRFNGVMHFVDARGLMTRAVFSELKPLDYCLAGIEPFTLDHFGSKLLGINPESVAYLEGTGEYTVEGVMPNQILPLSNRNSLKEKAHRFFYATFYWMDNAKCSVIGGKSIIPSLHWHLGIHPEIGDVTREELYEIASICPINAIDVDEGKINKEKCMEVRCLKCSEKFDRKIKLKGINRFSKMG
jgi:uncharacterized protein (DUF362 family)